MASKQLPAQSAIGSWPKRLRPRVLAIWRPLTPKTIRWRRC